MLRWPVILPTSYGQLAKGMGINKIAQAVLAFARE